MFAIQFLLLIFGAADYAAAGDCTCEEGDFLPPAVHGGHSGGILEWHSSVFKIEPKKPQDKSRRCYVQTLRNITNTGNGGQDGGQSILRLDWPEAGVASRQEIAPGFGLCAVIPDPDGLVSGQVSGRIIYVLTPRDRTRNLTQDAEPYAPRDGFGGGSRVPRDGQLFRLEPLTAETKENSRYAVVAPGGYTTSVGILDKDEKMIEGVRVNSYLGNDRGISFRVQRIGEKVSHIVVAVPLAEEQIYAASKKLLPGVVLGDQRLLEISLDKNGLNDFSLGPIKYNTLTIYYATVQARGADNRPMFTFYAPIIISQEFISVPENVRNTLWAP